jgi:signal transduction histidine kinase
MTPHRIRAALLGSSVVAGIALAVRLLVHIPLDRRRAELTALRGQIDEQRRRTADAVHAFRGPLAVMRTELDVGLRDPDLAPGAREVLLSAREEVDRVSRMADDLLTVAAIDEGSMRLRLARVALLEAIEAAAEPFRQVASAKRLTLHIGGEACHAYADAERLHQALGNLIDNAIKFSAPGGEIRLTAWSDAAQVGVTVTDSGPGVGADAQAHVFDRFYRDTGTGDSDAHGSGLGLAICRDIVAAHGGSVWLESEAGRGSAFSLALPRTHEARGPGIPT